ncbi:hypothetical protein HFP15_17860 [Amycolatopsis sp. K13G38]|uniref:Uncharacterized protein n=1 Tax=Amycolatopsis acididurans TaxID=2724524 RepID=A0ABX1J4M7_9PSEU|nr:hypothetical protein [Amycolatopsis acididurans]NKQ54752.1 hypothetical protein [Amycolatopsis acididurans]
MNEIMKMLLSEAKLPASDAEIGSYTAAYAVQRASVDALYEVAEARYVDPALRFRATARIQDWAS